MPAATLLTFADHGQVGTLMAIDGGDAEQTRTAFTQAGVDHHALATELQAEGAQSFDRSWQNLLASIASWLEQLTATGS